MLLQTAGSLVAILALAGLAWWLKLGGTPRLASEADVARAANDRAKASEMEHAIRSHIRKHTEEDPVLYRKLSERLNEIFRPSAASRAILSTMSATAAMRWC